MYKLINNSGTILRLSDSACIPASTDNSDYVEYLKWVSNGNTPHPADVPAITVYDYTLAVQKHLDDTAKQYGFDSVLSAVSYADEPTVPGFQTQGREFRKWRSKVWDCCNKVMADVQAQTRAQPSISELLLELPTL